MRFAPLAILLTCSSVLADEPREHHAVFVIAGESVRFDADMHPQFTANQLMNSAESTRAGLGQWAATPHGMRLIDYFDASEYEVIVTEDSGEEGVGRAPQPGIATLVAAVDHSQKKTYELVLNPTYFGVPEGMTPLANQPATPADMMAAAWAGEMLHIYFYSLGISLPHHQRPDFQREWRGVAAELGLATLTHDDDDGHRHTPSRARVLVLRSARSR